MAAVEAGEGLETLAHGLEVLERGGLELDPDQFPIPLVQGSAAKQHLARGRLVDPLQDLERRGLAGPIGTEQAEALAAQDLKTQAVDRPHPGEAAHQGLHVQDDVALRRR